MKSSTRFNTIGYWTGIVAIIALHVFLAAHLDIYSDEAYYWAWSKHLDISYIDHPPAIAYLIAFFEWLTGDRFWGIRLFPCLVKIGVTWLLFHLFFQRSPRGLWAILAVISTPIFTLGSVLMTPDLPLLIGAFLTFYGGLLFLDKQPYAKTHLIAGWVIGLLSKYHSIFMGLWGMLLLGFGRVASGLSTRSRVYALLLFVGFGIAGSLPTLYWNAQHGWVSFAYHLIYRHADTPGSALLYLVGLLGTLGMIPFMILFSGAKSYKTWLQEKKAKWAFLFLLFPWLGFLCLSFWTRINPNWLVVSYPAAIYLLFFIAKTESKKVLQVYFGLSLLQCVLLGTLVIHAISPLAIVPIELDRFSDVSHYRSLKDSLSVVKKTPSPVDLISDNYHSASLAYFYWPTTHFPVVVRVEPRHPKRPTLYDDLPIPPTVPRCHIIFTRKSSAPITQGATLLTTWKHLYRDRVLSEYFIYQRCP